MIHEHDELPIGATKVTYHFCGVWTYTKIAHGEAKFKQCLGGNALLSFFEIVVQEPRTANPWKKPCIAAFHNIPELGFVFF